VITRKLAAVLKELAGTVPVVALTGPRGSGKTTLAKSVFPDFACADLEDPATRLLAQEDEKSFFARYRPPVIIDEIERVPELLSAIQVMVDEDRESNGRFILVSSHRASDSKERPQSLAGRVSHLRLYPPGMDELREDGINLPGLDALLLRGFMPELYSRRSVPEPYDFYRNYLEACIEKDVRQMRNIRDPDKFRRFMALLAARTGQVLNLSVIAAGTGVSVPTIADWISVLITSDLVFAIMPYRSNISRRQIKSSKLYFSDVGLASYLLGIQNEKQMARYPGREQLFENLAVADAYKARLGQNKDPGLYFLRTEKGVGVDLILKSRGRLRPMQIRSSDAGSASLVRHLDLFCRAERSAAAPAVVCTGEGHDSAHGVSYINYMDLARDLETPV